MIDKSPRWMLATWALSGAVAAGFIWLVLQTSPDRIALPPNFYKLVAHKDVVIGSSLSWTALPHDENYANILNPGRATLVASLPSISESHSIDLLQATVAANANTVLLEVNAFAHEYNGLRNFPLAATLAGVIADTGKRLTLVARATIGLPAREYALIRLGRAATNQRDFVLAGPVEPELYTRTVWDTAGLKEALATAHREKTRLLFFWPPRPSWGGDRNRSNYREIRDHIRLLAKESGVPVWTAQEPWPDHLFMDNFGHLNATGRKLFASKISAWVKAQ